MSTINRIRTVAMSGLVLASALATPGTARAQAKFEFTPFVGSYYPLSAMCTDCNNDGDGTNFKGKQVNSAAIGARLSYWLSRTLGIQGSFTYTPSRAEERQDSAGFGIAFSGKGRVMMASGRLLFRPQRTNLNFIVGAGIVSRGDTVWQSVKSGSPDGVGAKLTSVAGILGIGVHASVTPKFALDVSAEANIYSFDPRFARTTTPTPNSSNGSKLQSDLILSIGVPITLSK